MNRPLVWAVNSLLASGLIHGLATEGAAHAASPVHSTTCATLSEGSVGPAVATLQERVHTAADGEYGPLTAAAVKTWQGRHQLDETGAVDAATWAALPTKVAVKACSEPVHGTGVAPTCARLREGSTGPAVAVLQAALHASADGTFGAETATALVSAQTAAELKASGITNRNGWAALGLSGTPACTALPVTPALGDPTRSSSTTGHTQAQRRIAEQSRLLATELLDRRGTTTNTAARSALTFAQRQTGRPYKWGAVGPKAYDCSGLTFAAYSHAGLSIPRVANDQYGAGRSIPLNRARAGDLLFYASDLTDPRSIYHVVMYVGLGQVIDAPQTGSTVSTHAMRTTQLLPVAIRPTAH